MLCRHISNLLKFCKLPGSLSAVQWKKFYHGSSHFQQYTQSKYNPCWKASLLLITAECFNSDNGKKQLHIEELVDLTHINLIKRATILAVDSATQLLTRTVAALLECSDEYREAMEEMMQLMEASVEQGNSSLYQQQIWDHMVAARNQLDAARQAVRELDSFVEYVIKLANDVAETSFLAGAEFVSTAMCERIHSIEKLLESEREKIKQLEGEYLKLQQKFVINYTENPDDVDSSEA